MSPLRSRHGPAYDTAVNPRPGSRVEPKARPVPATDSSTGRHGLKRAMSVESRSDADLASANAPVAGVGLLQLLASVCLLSSAWPLTKLALSAGSTPIWFAEGRA